MLGFQSISEQAQAGGTSDASTSSGQNGGSGGGGRFGPGSKAASGPASPRGHKKHRDWSHSTLPPDYWAVRIAYLYRKKKESEDDLP